MTRYFLDTEITPTSVKQLADEINQGTFLHLYYARKHIKQLLAYLLSQPYPYIYPFAYSLRCLCQAVKEKVLSEPQFNSICKELIAQVNKTEKEINDLVGGQAVKLKRTLTYMDKLFIQFRKSKIIRNQYQSEYDQTQGKQRGNSHEVRRKTDCEDSFIRWQPLYGIINDKFILQSDMKKRNEIHQQLKKYPLMNARFPCCSQFMYQGVNIKQHGVTQTAIDLMHSVHTIRQDSSQIKRKVGALINQGGGILLFDCYYQDCQVLPQGALITEKLKQSITDQISDILKDFRPKIVLGQTAQLHFVPVVRNPYAPGSKVINTQAKYELDYIQGRFVVRLKVWPKVSWKAYLSIDMIGMNLYDRKDGIAFEIKGKKAVKWIKQRFVQNYQGDQESQLGSFSGFGPTHKCPDPFFGLPIKQIVSKKMLELPVEYSLQIKHHFTCIIYLFWANKAHLAAQFKKFIKNFVVLAPTSKQTALFLPKSPHLLFHNSTHHAITNMLDEFNSQNNIPLNQKIFLLIIQTVASVSIKIPPQLFHEMKSQVFKKCSSEQLQVFFDEKDHKSYFQTKHKVSMFYLYIYLQSVKSRFKGKVNIKFQNVHILKDRLQDKQRCKIIYSTKWAL